MTETELRIMLARGGARIVGDAAPAAAILLPLPRPGVPIHADRYRSKTERRYALTILDVGIASGILKRYWYEPMKGLYLAPKTTYTVDFLVEYTDPTQPLECHEVKGGFIYPKDMQKTKMAAALYGCFRFILAQWKDQRWWFKEVPQH